MATKPMSFAGLGDLASLSAELDNHGGDKEFDSISLDLIDSQAQPRTVFEKIDELAESLKEIGQQQPIVVTETDNGRYLIEQGERRFRAAKLAGFTHIYCVIVKDDGDENQRIIRQLTENIQRDDMKLFELTKSVATLIDNGMTVRELAKQLGKKESYISTLKAVAVLPKDLEPLVTSRAIQDAPSLRKLKKLYEKFPKEVKRQVRKWVKQHEAKTSDDENPTAETPTVTRTVVTGFEKKLSADPSVSKGEAQKLNPDETPVSTSEDQVSSKKFKIVLPGELVYEVQYQGNRGVLVQTVLPPKGKLCIQLDHQDEMLTVDAKEVNFVGAILKK